MITDPRSIKICNELIRPACDRFGGLYLFCKQIQAQAAAEGWAKFFPDDVGEVVEDGAEKDGRPIINGHDVNEVLTIIGQLVTDLESGKTNSIFKVAVNPR